MASDSVPNRWMHLRQPRGFSETEFETFRASCDVFAAYAHSLLSNIHRFERKEKHPRIKYAFFPPELSADRTVATLPIGGEQTLLTRGDLENLCSFMLWQHLPIEAMEGLEEGLTETIDPKRGPFTNWRVPMKSIGFVNADPEWRERMRGIAKSLSSNNSLERPR